MENLLTGTYAVLKTTPARWLALTESLPAELLTHPPAPKEWPAMACLQHLVDTERWVFPVRVKAFLAGQDFPAYDPDSQGSVSNIQQSPRELAAEFAQLRANTLDAIAKLTTADLDRRARHAELGMVSLSEMLHEWVAHDLMHTVQAERALMQPFIQGCGPWLSYFTDHVAKQPEA